MRARRTKQSRQMVAALQEVGRKKRTFLREVSEILSDSLGFQVKVTLVKAKPPTNVPMRRAAKLSHRAAQAYYAGLENAGGEGSRNPIEEEN